MTNNYKRSFLCLVLGFCQIIFCYWEEYCQPKQHNLIKHTHLYAYYIYTHYTYLQIYRYIICVCIIYQVCIYTHTHKGISRCLQYYLSLLSPSSVLTFFFSQLKPHSLFSQFPFHNIYILIFFSLSRALLNMLYFLNLSMFLQLLVYILISEDLELRTIDEIEYVLLEFLCLGYL